MTAPTRTREETCGWLLCRNHGRGCDEYFKYWRNDYALLKAESERYSHEMVCRFRPPRSIGSFGGPSL